MTENKHWLRGTGFLSLLTGAIEGTEMALAHRLAAGEVERDEDVLTTVLMETLQERLRTVSAALHDLPTSHPSQPTVSRFDFSICDMRKSGRADAIGADVAFVLRVRWEPEFVSERGILVQAKRLGPLAERTLQRLDEEAIRYWGIHLTELEDLLSPFLVRGPLPPRLRRARFPWIYWPLIPLAGPGGFVLGDFPVDQDQLETLLHIASSYYLFYDYPVPHLTLPCVQALTVQGLLRGAGGDAVRRDAVLRQSMSLNDLLVHQFVGCRIGEWNSAFAQLAAIADRGRGGRLAVPDGDFQVHVWKVHFVVLLEITLLPLVPDHEE